MLTLSSNTAPVRGLEPAGVFADLGSPLGPDPDAGMARWHYQVVSLEGADLRAHGLLTGISNGSLHLTAAIAIAAGTRLQITIPSCRPIIGTVAASKVKDTAFHITVFFDPLPLALKCLDIGEPVWATQLEPLVVLGDSRVMDRAGTICALACHQRPQLDSWIRLDTKAAVVFGEVASILPIDGEKCAVGIRPEAVVSKVLEAKL